MSTVSINEEKLAPVIDRRRWSPALATLAVGALVFGYAFWSEIVHAIGVWNDSTAYNHCYLILPISAYLIWERRRAVGVRAPFPAPWPLLAMAPVALIWLIADKAQIMEGRQLAAMTLFQLFVLAVLGFKAWRVVAFALLYLYFLVPAGAFITPALQDFAARFAVHGVELLGVPVYSDGLDIEVPGARFTVAEACAGLRFLIASVALGTLYGYMMYRSWGRRAAFVVVSAVVPIIANGLRVVGIVMLGYWLGSAEAATADHLIYGWVFFSMVSFVLIILGLPFRQAVPVFMAAPSRAARSGETRLRMAAISAAALAMVCLLTSSWVSEGAPGAAVGRAVAGIRHVAGHPASGS
jgi:exosortase A